MKFLFPIYFLLRNHGIENILRKTNFKPKRMMELGFNYRLPDILCSLGISQLSRLDKFVKKIIHRDGLYIVEVLYFKQNNLYF